jgi:hypothetical protein
MPVYNDGSDEKKERTQIAILYKIEGGVCKYTGRHLSIQSSLDVSYRLVQHG